MLGLAHWSQGMHDAAVAELRKAVQLGGGPVPLADLGCPALLKKIGVEDDDAGNMIETHEHKGDFKEW